MITLNFTPAEHAFLLLKLGRGTGSTIRPGESLSAEEVLALTDKMEGAGSHPTGRAIQDAWIAGFMSAVGREPWDDMHDYAAVCAVEYAKRDAALSELAELDAPYL